MNIRQLTYFSKVYECGSFLKASQTLYISQQALSRTLAVLEQELGKPLFYRSHSGVTPTPLGIELYCSCQSVLQEMVCLEKHMKEFTRQNCGLLKIGVAAGSRYFNAKSVWHDFEEAHPGFILSVEEYTYKKSLELFESKELDVLIFSDYAAPAKYQSFSLKTLERMLLLPKDHPLFKKGKAQLSDLCEESLVLSINDFAYEKLCTLCSEHNSRPSEILRVSDTLYMYETCNLDRCIGITINRYFSDIFLNQFPNLGIMPFAENFFPYEINLIVRRDHPYLKTVSDLASYLKEYLKCK